MHGERLKEIRESRGLTQDDLAQRTGIHKQQIYKIEAGINDNPSSDSLTALSKELGVTVDYLLGLVDQPMGHLEEAALSPMEHKLIQALRNGLITEAFEALTAISKGINQSNITPDNPAVNG